MCIRDRGNVWCEWIPSRERMQYMAIPRLLAIAELGWSNPCLLYTSPSWTAASSTGWPTPRRSPACVLPMRASMASPTRSASAKRGLSSPRPPHSSCATSARCKMCIRDRLKLPRDTEQAKQAAAYMRSQNGVTVEEVTGE